MSTEVRYHMLRPDQVIERREACPVAYVPLGTLEWHGVHNPLGADTLQAEGIAIRCALQGGGLAFPALYYGENRGEALMEANAADRDFIAQGMGLAPENFRQERMPFSVMEQTLNYNRLLIHILSEVQTLGFRVGVLVAGHYPLIDHARAAVLQFTQRARWWGKNPMVAWAFADYLLVADEYEHAGDHAGGWETSHVMALHPETVDLDRLPPRGEKDVGVGGWLDPRDSTAEFGERTIKSAVDRATREVAHRLENPGHYLSHGHALDEGLWRTG